MTMRLASCAIQYFSSLRASAAVKNMTAITEPAMLSRFLQLAPRSNNWQALEQTAIGSCWLWDSNSDLFLLWF